MIIIEDFYLIQDWLMTGNSCVYSPLSISGVGKLFRARAASVGHDKSKGHTY